MDGETGEESARNLDRFPFAAEDQVIEECCQEGPDFGQQVDPEPVGEEVLAAEAAIIFAFTSASSAATLPVSKKCADSMGVDSDISSFVLPLGTTINMDGTAIYQCVATVFLTSCAGMELTLGQMVLVVLTATLASIGTAGVSGAGMIMLAMTLQAVGIPVSYIGLIVAVDRLFDMGRTCLNVTGDIACALCVNRWERTKQK